MALDFELYEYLNPDAVENLVTHSGSDAVISFTIDDLSVRIDAEYSVSVVQTSEE